MNILIVAEVYSENLGDGVIYTSLKGGILRHLPDAIVDGLDLSGNLDWVNPDEEKNRTNVFKQSFFIRFIKKISIVNKVYYAVSWYFKKRRQCLKYWNEKIKKADLVIIGGGQLLTDSNFGFPPKIFDIYLLCNKHNKPLSIFGCGVGKKWGFVSTILYRKVIKYANFVSVRDAVSAKRLADFTGRTCLHHPDPGFSICKNIGELILPPPVDGVEKKKLYINFQPLNDIKYFVPSLNKLNEIDYFIFWENIISQCHDDYEVSLFTNGHPGDYQVVQRFFNEIKLKNYNVHLLMRPTRPDELIRQLNQCDCIISTRMHAGIVAYSLRKAVIPISWDDKVNNVWFEVLGESSIVLDADVLTKKLSREEIESIFHRGKLNQNKVVDVASDEIDMYIKSLLTV